MPAGHFTALLGPNGAGKTTLMALVTHLFRPSEGRITVCGPDLAHHGCAALARMGGVFQRPTLDRDLTVARNLRHAAALRGLEGKTARRRIEAALARLGITGLSERTVRTLSGGEARRVELARALLRKPDLLVFDEAIVALGIESRQAIIDHVQSLCTSEGVVVLWTTHLLNEIRSEDQVVVLHRGRVRAQGSPAGLCRRSGTDNLADAFGQLTSD